MKPQITLPTLSLKSKLISTSTRFNLERSRKPEDEDHTITSRMLRSPDQLTPYSKSLSPSKGESRLKFFDNLKALPLSKKINQEDMTVSLAYLSECHRKNLSPIPLGLASNITDSVSIQNYAMGDNYAEAFSKGLNRIKNLEKLNLCANSLSPLGIRTILSTLPLKPVKELNLKDNRMNSKSLKPLLTMIQQPSATLKYLNLENTRVTDLEVIKLCEVISNDRVLNFLGLAMNSLGLQSAEAIKNMLAENHYLQKLDLHWNHFKDQGSLLVFEGLSKNDSLKELDLSWNSMGNNKDKGTLKSIAGLFVKIQGLAHLDLSFNSLTSEECFILGEGLKSNHDILGIHVIGNEGMIDSQGFLNKTESIMHFEQSHLYKRLFDESKNVKMYLKRPKIKCWICEGWVEMKFSWNLNLSGGSSNGDMFIHLDCDNYEPDLMKLKDNSYEILRVVPAGEIKFFFTKNGFTMRSKEYELYEFPRPEDREIHFSDKFWITVSLHVINKTNAKGPPCDYKNPFKTGPRAPRYFYDQPQEKLERIKWEISKSLFKDYRFLDNTLAEECLEFDWAQSKIPNWVKPADQAALKELLKENYVEIIETFKYLSSQSPNEYFTVGSNVFYEFLNQNNAFDALYDQGDLGVNWNSVLVSKDKKQPYNPGNSLVRYQFTEILLRIANDRYIRSKVSQNIVDGFKLLLKEKIGPGLKSFKSSQWREQEYLKETVDIMLKSHKPILDVIFKMYSGRKSLPGQKPFMCIDEFRQLCIDSKIIPEKYNARDIDGCFIYAMMVQVDELFDKKHIEMSFVEFLEAFCRLCWLVSTDQKAELEDEIELSIFHQYGIHVELKDKIEKAIWSLYHLCPKQIHDNFTFPDQMVYKSFMYKYERMPTMIRENYSGL